MDKLKPCPFCQRTVLEGSNGELRKTVGWLCSAVCDKCPACNPERHGYNSVFNQITQSPEVLAPYFVFLKAVFVTNINPKQQWISTLAGDVYQTKAEAIAATVAKLKEVCDV